jgi:hypothetical protein
MVSTPVLLPLHYMNVIAGNLMDKKNSGTWQCHVPDEKKALFCISKIPALLKSSFFSIRLFSAAAWRMTPSLPQRGKQPKGSIPFDPLFFSGYISTLSGVIAIGGMPERRGRKHENLEPPGAIVCFSEDFNRAKIPVFF